MNPALSICICTYNRADVLNEMLSSLVAVASTLQLGDEVIVIDNNSTDHTKGVVELFVDFLPVRRVVEEAQGLSNARNRALQEANNESVVFFDDDVWIGSHALPEYRKAFLQHREIAFFGGQIEVGWPNGVPAWWVTDDLPLLNGLLVKYDLGDRQVVLDQHSHLPYGANFGLRKTLVDKIGGFDPDLGPLGGPEKGGLGRGDDTDFFLRALRLGEAGLYLPNAVVEHRFDSQRIRISYLLRYGREKGKRSTFDPSVWSLCSKVMRQLIGGAVQLLKNRKDRAFQCVINIGIAFGRYRRID